MEIKKPPETIIFEKKHGKKSIQKVLEKPNLLKQNDALKKEFNEIKEQKRVVEIKAKNLGIANQRLKTENKSVLETIERISWPKLRTQHKKENTANQQKTQLVGDSREFSKIEEQKSLGEMRLEKLETENDKLKTEVENEKLKAENKSVLEKLDIQTKKEDPTNEEKIKQPGVVGSILKTAIKQITGS